MKWNMYYARQDFEDAISLLRTFLELDVLVPEGMREEVKTNSFCATLE